MADVIIIGVIGVLAIMLAVVLVVAAAIMILARRPLELPEQKGASPPDRTKIDGVLRWDSVI